MTVLLVDQLQDGPPRFFGQPVPGIDDGAQIRRKVCRKMCRAVLNLYNSLEICRLFESLRAYWSPSEKPGLFSPGLDWMGLRCIIRIDWPDLGDKSDTVAPPFGSGGRNYRTDFLRFSRHHFGKADNHGSLSFFNFWAQRASPKAMTPAPVNLAAGPCFCTVGLRLFF